jgi:hypothetical protein
MSSDFLFVLTCLATAPLVLHPDPSSNLMVKNAEARHTKIRVYRPVSVHSLYLWLRGRE